MTLATRASGPELMDADDLDAEVSGAKFAVNITNLTDERYASNFDSSVFAPDDAAGSILVFHASAPRQVFATISFDF